MHDRGSFFKLTVMKKINGRRLFAACIWFLLLLGSPDIVSGQEGEWKVWVRISPCSGRFDWITIAKENPTGGGNFYYLANFIFPGTTCTNFGCSFAAATAVANTIRPSGEFFKYCCRDYSVWENSQTGKRSVVVGKFGTAGMGWNLVKGDLCCEEAEALSGIPGACSGSTGNQQVINQTQCWPNSYAAWNPTTNKVECYCKPGYEWNATRTACVQSKPDCNSYYPNSEARLNPQTNLYECYCKAGFEWNSTRTACVQSAPDCNAYYPNSEARLNPQTNLYECYCKTGFEWNSTRTACVQSAPDCNSYYPNSEARLNPQTNLYECYCKAGFEWNSTRTACVQSAPDCNSYYPNSEARLNPQTNLYECYCKTGYQWNAARTACVQLQLPDCNSYYPNSEARLNTQTNAYECYCRAGYQWNATRTACVQAQAPDCNVYYANSEARLNPQTNVYECFCKPGYEWNATRTACIIGNRDNPPVSPQQQKTGQCSTTYYNGANEPEQYTITMAQATGTVSFYYNTYTVKDRIHIYQGNSKIFDSGCVGTSGTTNLNLNGSSYMIRIVVDPLCEPNETQNTQWEFNFSCPR
jgi:predicted GNAT family N-acyltransferase